MSRVFVSPLATPFHSLVPIFPIPSRYISIFRAPPPRYFSPSLKMCRDKALITRKIRELEGRNLVRRERNPSDQRSFQLFLTDEGLAIHQHAEAIMSRVHDELFAPLTPVEQATLVHLLDQCLAAQPLEDI